MKNKYDKIIIGLIIVCLILITIYKKNEHKLLNKGFVEGFEYYTTPNYTLTKDALSGYPLVIILGSKMCASCEEMSIVTKKLNKDFQGKVKIKYVDILENKKLKERFRPRVTPTIIIGDKTGKIMKTIEGVTTKKEILKYIKKTGVDIND